jgi:flagellar hook-associated protein 1 FlgK
MMDLLSLGASGVRAFQAALSVTGDNVANADTPGYVRRTLTLAPVARGAGTPLERDDSGGSGVRANQLGRASDALKASAARTAASDEARLSARLDWLERLESQTANANLSGRIGAFFDAGTDLAASPTSMAARTLFLASLDGAVGGFNTLATNLQRLDEDVTAQINLRLAEANRLGGALARLNGDIRRTATDTSAALGLADTRDRLLADLAGLVRISVSQGAKGEAIVRLGTGPMAPLLVGETGAPMAIGVNNTGAAPELVLNPAFDPQPLRLPASGGIAGLMEAGRRIAGARNDLDVQASRFADAINRWQGEGIDFQGSVGQALLNTTTLEVTGGRANAGTASADIILAEGAGLAADGYQLLADAGGFTLMRRDGSAMVSGPPPLLLDGVTVRVAGTARMGDSFDLLPRAGALGLALRPLGPESVAVAGPFQADADPRNGSRAAMTVTAAANAGGPVGPLPWRVTMGATDAEVRDALGTLLGIVPADGSPQAGAGFRFAVPSDARPGDSFRIIATPAGSAGNANALGLGRVRDTGSPAGTLEAAQDTLLAGMGAAVTETRQLGDIARAVKGDADLALAAVTAVNLDAEAAELTRLQAAYRANAQLLGVARDLFDTLFGMM